MKLYIDPGTGSMLFTILIGLLGTAAFLFRNIFVKLRFILSGGAKEKSAEKNWLSYVIFSDHKRYWNVFEPICDEFERRGESLTYMTASPDDPALGKEYNHVKCEFIGEGNKAFAHLNFLKADVLLSTTPGLDVYQWKRSRDVRWYAHVLHAASDAVLYRMFGIDYYDAILLSGEYQIGQIRELEHKRKLPEKELVLTGLPALDQMMKRLEKSAPLPTHPITILLAPSWGKSAIFSSYGASIIEALLATGYHIIVRPHPQSFISEKEMIDGLLNEYPESDQLEWNRDNDNFEVLRRSDLLISDFSGVIFDYTLVFQRPVIYADTSFDKSPYDAWWTDDELWTFKTLPKIGKQLNKDDLGDLRSVIDSVLNDKSYRDAIAEARDETWAYRGQAAGKITDYLIEKRYELLEGAETEEENIQGAPEE